MIGALSRRQLGALLAIIGTTLGMAIVAVLYNFGIRDSAIVIALLFLPMVIYLAVSGDVSEVTGPGGFSAKFRDFAETEVEAKRLGGDAEAEIQSIQIVEKSSREALRRRMEHIGTDSNLVMTLELGRRSYYSPSAVRAYVEALRGKNDKLLIIFVSGDGDFIASSTASSFISAMQDHESANDLVQAIEDGNIDQVGEQILLQYTSIPLGVSNATALRKLIDSGVDAMIAIDNRAKPVGIVRRDDIMAQMLVKLAPSPL